MVRIFKLLLIQLLFLASHISAVDYEKFPTAYVEEKGGFCLTAAYWRHDANHFFNRYGHRVYAHNDFTLNEWSLYFAYGLTARDTLSLKGAWANVDESLDGKNFGFEEVELSVKHCFGQKNCLLLSAELVAIIPCETEHKPALRYGEYGFEANLLASTRFRWGNLSTQSDGRIGYRYYHGFPGDQIRADYTLSLFPCYCLKIAGNLHLEYGLYNGDGSVSRWHCSFFRESPNYRLLQGEIRLTLAATRRTELTVGYHRHFWGRNIATGGGLMGEATLNF